jgi:hypothetical protein
VNVCTAEKNRVEKLLEDAQIKLSVVASDIFGVSSREMMAASPPGGPTPSRRTLPTHRQTPGQEESHRRGRPLDPGHRLAPAVQSRRQLPRPRL